MAELKIFYDGGCPLCLSEMKHLMKLDQQQKIDLVDINQESFQAKYPNINREKADRILHGQLANGKILLGLDVTHKACILSITSDKHSATKSGSNSLPSGTVA